MRTDWRSSFIISPQVQDEDDRYLAITLDRIMGTDAKVELPVTLQIKIDGPIDPYLGLSWQFCAIDVYLWEVQAGGNWITEEED